MKMKDVETHETDLAWHLKMPTLEALDCLVRFAHTFGTDKQTEKVKSYRCVCYIHLTGNGFEGDITNENQI